MFIKETDQMSEKCEKCKFWRPSDRPGAGYYHRYAPRYGSVPTGPDEWFPPMPSFGWCGEFEPVE